MKKILIAGANGLLGQKMVAICRRRYHIHAAARQEQLGVSDAYLTYHSLDITDSRACKDLIHGLKPDVVVNAAAFTQVDGCESDRETCWNVNVKGVEHLAAACRKNMSLLVHISTDYIFDGADGPYREDDPPNPLGYYGKGKLASENVVRLAGIPYAIIRTNVVYGSGVGVKNNFFLWLYNSLKAGKAIRVVTDQFNNPVLAEDLALGISRLIDHSKYGVYHLAGLEYVNRYDFAMAVAEVFEFDPGLITPITTDMLSQASPRPMRGGLSIERARADFGYQPRSIRETLAYLKSRI